MKKKLLNLLFIFLINSFMLNGQIAITTDTCPVLKRGTLFACGDGGHNWGKIYNLQDFGINSDNEFIIDSGEIGLAGVDWGVSIKFNIYEIDSNFPASFSSSNLIGSSQEINVPFSSNNNPKLISIDFENSVKVNNNTELIFVEVEQLSGDIVYAANTDNNNALSWLKIDGGGCPSIRDYTSTNNLGFRFIGANYHIAISGKTNNLNNPFTLNYSNNCTSIYKEFELNNINNINYVEWDFGDPASGTNNNSTLISPTHDFSSSGQYSITAAITQTDGTTYTINETISVAEPPIAHPINDIHECENTLGSGISSSFDTSNVESQVLNRQTGVIVTYYDQNGNELPNPLPNPYTNTVPNSEVLTVRVSDSSDLCCYTETSFSLTVDQLPNLNQIDDIFSCDNNEDGFTVFNLTNVPTEIINNPSNLIVELFDSNDNLISVSDYINFTNLTANQDYIKAIATDTTTNCSSEITINLLVNDNPIASQLPTIYGCDDNNNGISEYFDTSNVESQVLNGQTGTSVNYFDENGNQLSSPLPNPYTNSIPFNEFITVRVTNNNSTCYAETTLQLQSVTQPNINQLDNLYACDQGYGYAKFDTSLIEQELIGNQTGLTIQYFDSDNNALTSPLPELFQNTEPFSQTINIRVEDASNPICYSETSFDLIVNELPIINLEDEYFICNLEPSILLNINSEFNSYSWLFEDGTLISSTNSGEISEEGNYTLTVTQIENGITCENSFDFTLIRSVLPEIQQVNFGELGNNYIEIIASGDGDFEYSIDGFNYQESNYFPNILGGTYNTYVRDKNGCGEDSKKATIIDYPKFFTPNNDGINDYWQINGIENLSNCEILIFDRFGKLIAQLSSNDIGWDGILNNKHLPSSEYWFKANLNKEIIFTGHFTLKR